MSPSVIIVDDQPILADALAERLAAEGYETAVASCAGEALEAIGKRSYDLAFLDLRLPDMSGAVLASEFKKRCPRAGVVLMSGFLTSIHDPEVRLAQIDAVLPKPWKSGELESVLKALWRRNP